MGLGFGPSKKFYSEFYKIFASSRFESRLSCSSVQNIHNANQLVSRKQADLMTEIIMTRFNKIDINNCQMDLRMRKLTKIIDIILNSIKYIIIFIL